VDAALIIAFYTAVAVLIIRVPQINLAVAALLLTALLVVALIAQATFAERLGGYAAIGLVFATVLVALAVHFGAWVSNDSRR
jgi:hypothetical protein